MTTTANTVRDAVEALLAARDEDPGAIVARADAGLSADAEAPLDGSSSRPADLGPLARPVALTLEAAALVAIADGSVRAAASFTRERRVPRPLPGVERATGDPFAQTLLGAGLVEAQGAAALVRVAAGELDAALESADPDVDAVTARALSAFEQAARVALDQAERVWEVVGTSGSQLRHGFHRAWEVARPLTLRHPRAARRREAAPSYLAWATATIDEVAA